jgi:hypothetical protein
MTIVGAVPGASVSFVPPPELSRNQTDIDIDVQPPQTMQPGASSRRLVQTLCIVEASLTKLDRLSICVWLF